MKRMRKFLSLLSLAALPLIGLGLPPVTEVAAQSQSLCNRSQFFGRILYNIAFPMATYEKASCKILEHRNNGNIVYNFQVIGKGIWFQAPLWTEVVLLTNSSGQLIDFAWGRHNSEFWPPGSTYKAAIEVMKDALKQPASNSTKVGAICLKNPTNEKLHYSYRWGEGEWFTDSIEAKQSMSHWWTYAPGSQTSPNFQIQFDDSFSEGYTAVTYNLERYSTTEPVQCNQSRKYYFSIVDNQVRLYSED
jgi:hypothetical protein